MASSLWSSLGATAGTPNRGCRPVASTAVFRENTLTAAELRADLAGKPAALSALAQRLSRAEPFRALPGLIEHGPSDVVFLGLGPASYAAAPAAARLELAGVHTRMESPAAVRLGPAGPDTLVVAVVVGSGQRELAAALDHYMGTAPIVLLVADPTSVLTHYADIVAALEVGQEFATSRSYQHAQALLLHLAARLGAPPAGASSDVAVVVRRAANATADLLERAGDWVPRLAQTLSSSSGLHLLAPLERLSSAQQGALAIRKGPVHIAHASETAQWSHTDRYLAAAQRYRAVLFRGSRFDERAAEHMLQLRARFVTVGGDLEGQAAGLRFSGDDDEDVSLLTEPLVPELLAAHWWAEREAQAVPRTQEA